MTRTARLQHVPSLVFVGGGPRTVGILERIAASAPELLGPSDKESSGSVPGLDIHVVDPFPAGGGRIWRTSQSPLLWMNSTTADVTIFTDESVTCDGPIVPGPSLAEWVAGPGRGILGAAGLGAAAERTGPADFASRQIQSHYLRWAYARVVSSLPRQVRVTEHRTHAVDVSEHGTQQRVRLADGTVLPADVVVLAQGFLDRELTAEEARLAAAAKDHGLTYLPPGYTADVDLSDLKAGKPVLVRGFGLAFVDVLVLLGEGRGGRFTDNDDGTLTYLRSGREPVLHVGSRRGVPYHAKISYTVPGRAPVPPRYFTAEAITAIGDGRRPCDFRQDLWPLMTKELTAAHYRHLFQTYPERTLNSWDEFSAQLDDAVVGSEAFSQVVGQVVPKREDRFDLPAIDRPLAGRHFGSRDDLRDAVVEYIRADLTRRADPYHSADAAVFDALLTVYGVLAWAITAGRIAPADRLRFVDGEFHGFFSFLASGPPPRRLAEMLALHDAGLLHFAGPDLQISVRNGTFVGSSPAVGGGIVARALVDARLPRPDVRAATDPVIKGLLAGGQLAAEDINGPDGGTPSGGQLLADERCRAVRANGSIHDRLFLLGPSVSGSAGSAGFSRPGFDGPGFRQNDRVARDILRLLHSPREMESIHAR